MSRSRENESNAYERIMASRKNNGAARKAVEINVEKKGRSVVHAVGNIVRIIYGQEVKG